MSNPAKYRYRDLKPEDPYYEAWRQHRSLGMESLAVFGLFFAYMLFLWFSWGHVIGEFLRGRVESDVARVIGLLLVGGPALVVLLIRLRLSRQQSGFACPKCGQRFYTKYVEYRDGLTCHNCHLPKWAPDDPDKAPAHD